MRLLKELQPFPQPQRQPCKSSCVPTSIAMAYGLSADTVIDSMTERGIFKDGSGVRDDHLKWFLAQNMQGYSEWSPLDGCGPLPGHHLCSVLSKSIPEATHCCLLVADDCGDCYMFDPSAVDLTPKKNNLHEVAIQNFITLRDWSDIEFLE